MFDNVFYTGGYILTALLQAMQQILLSNDVYNLVVSCALLINPLTTGVIQEKKKKKEDEKHTHTHTHTHTKTTKKKNKTKLNDATTCIPLFIMFVVRLDSEGATNFVVYTFFCRSFFFVFFGSRCRM